MGVSLLLIALTGVFWFLGMRNADEVIGILEKLMAAVLLVLTLSFGGMHQAVCIGLLLVALSLPKASSFASTRNTSRGDVPGDANSDELFLKF